MGSFFCEIHNLKKVKIMTSKFLELLTQNLIQLTAINQQYGIQLNSVKSDISEQKQRTKLLEIKFDSLSGESDYCTVRGYCNINRIKISEREANSLGRHAAKICRQKGYLIGKVQDERHGKVNSYPIEVLEEVSKPYKKQIRAS
ncbi:hypothetical protein A2T98_17130 [Nodularia spumigena CENA596]|uniref:Uncharacterized protein n=2 Tax=Nodularia spumigena TaxID=70799 RepID=A0A166ING4_NODSP|nr:hypothetical protein NSP_39010 [Nodularia spumigena CCY9414]EAW44929.1 hypothetical protein N9414_03106 [Nodularia spumigena CCY9414]KZL48630.1 hypothetical protein A2T98_17130 [Nodularia spumigena CENA596]